MNLRYFLALSLISLSTSSAHADVIGYYEMKPTDNVSVLNDVISNAMHASSTAKEEALGVFDWDNTVSQKDGANHPREGIEHVMNFFTANKIPTIVLTNRMKGLDIDTIRKVSGSPDPVHFVRSHSQKMLTELTAKLEGASNAFIDSAFAPCTLTEDSELKVFKELAGTFLLVNNVLFGGTKGPGSNKGDALLALLNSDVKLNSKPKFIVMMDDIKVNLVSIGKSFENRPEKVLLIYVHHVETARDVRNFGDANTTLAKYPQSPPPSVSNSPRSPHRSLKTEPKSSVPVE